MFLIFSEQNKVFQEGSALYSRQANRSLLFRVLLFHHRHGVKQVRSGWADGPAYITQCPIQSNKSYTYKFRVIKQRGTLWWHAHLSWQRASVHGAFIIHPRSPYPFSIPIAAEIPIVLGNLNNNLQSICYNTVYRSTCKWLTIPKSTNS